MDDGLVAWEKAGYSGDNLVCKVRALIKNKGLEEDVMMVDSVHANGNQKKLRTICSVICRELGGDRGRARADDPVFLCSDVCHAGGEESHIVCTVCDAARATSAAPTYFPEMKLFDKVLVDGAYGNTNNPSHAVFGHFQDWTRLTSRHPHPVMMVNVGADTMPRGVKAQEMTQERPLWAYMLPKLFLDLFHLTRDLSTMSTDCEGVGKLMREIESVNPKFQYWRFSEDETLFGTALDDWQAVEDGSIVEATKKYLDKPEVLEELSRTARALAIHSRAHRYAQRDRTVRVEIPTTSSKSSSQQTSEGSSLDKVQVVVNLPAGNADELAQKRTQLELQLGDGIQLDDLKQPIVAKMDVNGETKQVEVKAAEVQGRRRQSSGPTELFHQARAELRDTVAKDKKREGSG